MPVDTIYRTPRKPVPPFEFDEQVAAVFNDMIRRSVPGYLEIIRRQVQLIIHYYQPGTCIYDLGCSTGNLGLGMCCHRPDLNFKMISVDNAEPMIDRYKQRLAQVQGSERIELRCQDIRHVKLAHASAVVLNYTLQFLPVADRDALLHRIHKALVPKGVFLFCEKITHTQPEIADLQQSFYHAYKRENGYSELEISQKREALEKVLIPETVETHLARLQKVGFAGMDIWHKWFNFAAFIALKA